MARDRARGNRYLAAISGIALIVMVGLQARRVVAPDRFAAPTFGILLAELSEGGNYERTATARELSDQIHESLCATIRESFAGHLTAIPHPLGDARDAGPRSAR